MTNEPLYGTPVVGGDTLSYCGKCKIELAHVIVSMVRARPSKVVCKTCKSQHNFKGSIPDNLLRKPTRTAKPKAEKISIKASDYWEKKLAENSKTVAKDYTVKEVFKKADVIQHPQFGVGLVEEVRLAGKIVVIFRGGEKILVHGMGTGSASH